jgi:bifunctional pyridoxal-dependent enzyme with beta-cystathionase and maltose regulon repressor activities
VRLNFGTSPEIITEAVARIASLRSGDEVRGAGVEE